ncbi:ABC transporter permease [Rhodoligotrophos defluvii]|uniref:ABC transporter permease n=1 Tax=Rhodoligotrophos defluvii TaxID=2561934 RepID=UPI0010CA1B8F|nr:ABC transporter permease [Rhodoligotrophos defluvii]
MSRLPLSLRIISNACASLVLAFLVLPILAVIPASFNAASFIHLPPHAYSGVWYQRFLDDGEWRSSLMNSVEVGLLATVIAVVLGTLAALGLRRIEGRLRGIVTGLFLAPLIVPVIVTAVAIYRSAIDVQLNGTILGMSLSHVVLALPFVVINVGIALRAVSESWLRAAAGLGAGPWKIFRTITLPNILPGIVGGAIFSFITSFDEVVIAVFMAGYGNKTLPVKMWESVRLEFTPVIAVAATVMIALALLLFVAAERASRAGRGQPS